MITIFDYIKGILYTKDDNIFQNLGDESSFNPYLCQRWLSMASPEICKQLNCTSNELWSIHKTKEEWYNFFLVMIPKQTKFKKITYLKKVKSDTKEKELTNIIDFLSKNMELSRREIKDYIDNNNLDVSELKKIIKE